MNDASLRRENVDSPPPLVSPRYTFFSLLSPQFPPFLTSFPRLGFAFSLSYPCLPSSLSLPCLPSLSPCPPPISLLVAPRTPLLSQPSPLFVSSRPPIPIIALSPPLLVSPRSSLLFSLSLSPLPSLSSLIFALSLLSPLCLPSPSHSYLRSLSPPLLVSPRSPLLSQLSFLSTLSINSFRVCYLCLLSFFSALFPILPLSLSVFFHFSPSSSPFPTSQCSLSLTLSYSL